MRSKKQLQQILTQIKQQEVYNCFELICYISTAEIFLTHGQFYEADELIHLLEKADPGKLKKTNYGQMIKLIKDHVTVFGKLTADQINKSL